MKHKTKIIIALTAFIIISIPILLYNIGKACYTNKRVLETNWTISIPQDYKEKYYYTSEHGFQGDGWRYFVFEKGSASYIAINSGERNGVSRGYSGERRNEAIERFVQIIAEKLDVPQETRPPFDNQYIWENIIKDNDKLAIIYSLDSNLVYIAEELI